jgi:beta-glucosidase
MIRIRVSVSNIGLRSGAEVVQVYVKPPVSAVNRPYKELKAFRKVFLDASLEEEVEFELESKYATSYWDEGHDSWAIEKGTYSVLVGTSSQGSFLTESFIIESTSWWTGI